MKKALILFGIFLLVGNYGFSQIKPFRFGLKLAPNFAWVSPDSEGYEKDGASPGFSWGFISDFTLTENYFIGTGFNMNYLSGKINYPDKIEIIEDGDTAQYEGTMKRKYNFRYIEIPVTLKMKTNKFNELQFYGQIGFSAGFKLRAKAEDNFTYKSDGNYQSQSANKDVSEDVTLVKGALLLGGGVEYYLDQSTSLIFGLLYSSGLSNIMKGENNLDSSIQEKALLSHIEITVGVIF
jgi:hypothetical protein